MRISYLREAANRKYTFSQGNLQILDGSIDVQNDIVRSNWRSKNDFLHDVATMQPSRSCFLQKQGANFEKIIFKPVFPPSLFFKTRSVGYAPVRTKDANHRHPSIHKDAICSAPLPAGPFRTGQPHRCILRFSSGRPPKGI